MVTEAHFGAFSQDPRFALSTCYFFLSKSTVSQGKHCELTRGDEFSDGKPGTIPALHGHLAVPENAVAGGHLLSRRVPPNTNLLEPRQHLPKPWHIPVPCVASSICLAHCWDYVLVAVLMPRALCQTRGRCSHREEQL